jgi:hypothetical protein
MWLAFCIRFEHGYYGTSSQSFSFGILAWVSRICQGFILTLLAVTDCRIYQTYATTSHDLNGQLSKEILFIEKETEFRKIQSQIFFGECMHGDGGVRGLIERAFYW